MELSQSFNSINGSSPSKMLTYLDLGLVEVVLDNEVMLDGEVVTCLALQSTVFMAGSHILALNGV